jgi:hypothetical protein
MRNVAKEKFGVGPKVTDVGAKYLQYVGFEFLKIQGAYQPINGLV